MQNKQKINRFASLLPPVPESYRTRMEDVLAALPVESTRTVSVGRFTKKQLIVLIAALITLLTVGTTMAVAISRMGEIRDEGLEKIDTLSGIVYGTVEPGEPVPDNASGSDAYIPVGVGMNDENGSWQPYGLDELDETVQVGVYTVRLKNIQFNPSGDFKLTANVYVETDSDAACYCEPFMLSINGDEPIRQNTRDGSERYPDMTPEPMRFERNKEGKYTDGRTLRFAVDENPFRPDTTFTFSSKINGELFTLTYSLTAERFEKLRQETVRSLNDYAELLKDIPADSIPVGVACEGYCIEEIAIKGRWLYYIVDTVPAYWETHKSGRDNAPFGSYDDGGLYAVIDGMRCPDSEFISSKRGDGEHDLTQLERVYIPYPDALPDESLLTLRGAPFRIEWVTGKVRTPKDEAEYLAWRQESETLSKELGDYDSNYIAKPYVKADTFTVSELVYMNRVGLQGMIGLILETDEAVKKPFDGKDRQPSVTVAGETFEGMTYDYSALDKFEGGTKNGGRRVGFLLYGAAYSTLPETFDVTVTWNGSSVMFSMQKSDFIRCYDKEGDWEPFLRDYSEFGI